MYGAGYFAANHRGGAWEPVRLGFDCLALAQLERHVLALAPRAVVATHHLPLVVLGRSRERGRLKASLTAVVTDYTAHACWAERGVERFCVPNARAFEELVLHGVDPYAVHLTGIPVRPEFERIPRVREPRAGEPMRVLVTSGGFGVGPMREIVRSFAGIPGVELTVVCGRAESLRRRIARDVQRAGLAARVLGFEEDMPSRVAEAHVVVGKAGGLTVSEVMTAGRPLVLVGAVPGNETINEEFVVKNGAGAVAAATEEARARSRRAGGRSASRPGPGSASRPRTRSASDVGHIVAEMRARSLIEPMGARARQLVRPGAAENVIRAALGELDPPARKAAGA
jgi:processive 1,2-diacylglycerol beta-glucosyltransferase